MNFGFEPMNFVTNLKYMGIGMLGVFIIIGIIIAATYAVGSINFKKPKDGSED